MIPLSEWGQGRRWPRAHQSIRAEGCTGHYGGESPWRGVDRSSAARFETTADHARCPQILRAWWDYHMAQGWNGLAYSAAVCPHGELYAGRGPAKRTAAQGTNAGNARSHALVYIAGGDDPLSAAAKAAALSAEQTLGPLRWAHRDWIATACPGDPFAAWIHAGRPAPDDIPTPPDEEDEIMAAKDEIIAEVSDLIDAAVTRTAWGALDLELKLGRPGVIVRTPETSTQWFLSIDGEGKPIKVGLTSQKHRDFLRRVGLAGRNIREVTDPDDIAVLDALPEVRW